MARGSLLVALCSWLLARGSLQVARRLEEGWALALHKIDTQFFGVYFLSVLLSIFPLQQFFIPHRTRRDTVNSSTER